MTLKNPQPTTVKESNLLIFNKFSTLVYLLLSSLPSKSLKTWLCKSLILSVLTLVTGYKHIPVELKSMSHKELLYKNGGFINLNYYNTLQNNYCK